MRTGLSAALGCLWFVTGAAPPVSGHSARPDDLAGRHRSRLDVPEPGDQRRTDGGQVEDFPYVTEEYFVSGTAKDAPYTTRIIVRRPKDPDTFSGVVVAEALHAGGRSLVFEWSRVSILRAATCSSRSCTARRTSTCSRRSTPNATRH